MKVVSLSCNPQRRCLIGFPRLTIQWVHVHTYYNIIFFHSIQYFLYNLICYKLMHKAIYISRCLYLRLVLRRWVLQYEMCVVIVDVQNFNNKQEERMFLPSRPSEDVKVSSLTLSWWSFRAYPEYRC
jgi:hypothetical protein